MILQLVTMAGGNPYRMNEISWAEYDALPHKEIVGVPTYWTRDVQGGIYVWPKPMDGVEVYRLEIQGYVK